MNNPALRNSILQTLAYFDVRGLPLTSEELEQYLWKPPKFAKTDFNEAIDLLKKEQVIDEKWGLHFLTGRAELVEKRRAAGLVTEQKLNRARRGARLLRFVPFVRAVLVCNSVAEEKATLESDIDLFVITAQGRIWIARLGCNLILKLFGLRTSARHERDKLCLSYFVGADHFNLAGTRVSPEDIHLAYWLHNMIPVYDPQNYFERLLQANEWTQSLIPALQHNRAVGAVQVIDNSRAARFWRQMWEKFWQAGYGDIIEKEAKKIQLDLLTRRLVDKINAGDKGAIIKDGIIKLHEHDSRVQVRNEWLEKLKKYGAS